jgi:hypothetical protein
VGFRVMALALSSKKMPGILCTQVQVEGTALWAGGGASAGASDGLLSSTFSPI